MKIDLHIHSVFSKCSVLRPNQILKIAKQRGLNGIAITDHNTIRGALEVAKLNKDKDFKVILGAEIKTQYGEILAYNIQEDIKSRDFEEVIEEIHRQGGLAVMAHPFGPGIIRKALPAEFSEINLKKLDGFEVLNGRTFPWQNKRAREIASKIGLAGTGGSDAHFPGEIGKVYSEFRGSLKNALKSKKIRACGDSKMLSLLMYRSLSMFVKTYSPLTKMFIINITSSQK